MPPPVVSAQAAQELLALRHQFVAGLTRDMQKHIESLVDLREVVVGQLVPTAVSEALRALGSSPRAAPKMRRVCF